MLMENVGRGLYENLQDKLTKQDSIVILSGTGNNGGDGIVLARYLKENNYNVILTFPLGKPTSETAQHHLAFFEQQGFEVSMFDYYQTYDVIIDSLIGVSLNRDRKSTRLNSSHVSISYAVFCLKKKNDTNVKA